MGSIFYLIQQSFDSLSPSEQKVANFVLENPIIAMDCGVAQLATFAGTSSASVVRLCKRLNIGGFNNLKLMLAKDIFTVVEEKPVSDFNFTSSSTTEEIIDKILLDVKNNFDNVGKLLNLKTLNKAVNAILTARSVNLFGSGASGIVAMDFHQKLTRLGILSFYNIDTHMQITSAAVTSTEDVAVAFSYSGETTDVLVATREAEKSGATTIGITRIGNNSLAKICKHVICIPESESQLRHGATLSRLSQLLVVDILYASLITKNMDTSMNNILHTRDAVQVETKLESSRDKLG